MTTTDAVPLRPRTTPIPLLAVAQRIGASPTAAGVGIDADPLVTGITHDSRSVVPGDLYAALSGAHHHGAEFVAQAAAAGAVAVLTDEAGVDRVAATGLPMLVVPDVRRVLGAASSAVYGDPVHQLVVLGVTGTNGKTTTAYLLDAAMRACGHRTGLIGTIATLIDGQAVASVRTTPEATDLHALLAIMRERGVDTVVMEVSSHALVMGRVDDVVFDVVGFTNLSQDHLDFHQSMQAYFDAKASLFVAERARCGVVMGSGDESGEWSRRLLATATIPLVAVESQALADEAVADVPVHSAELVTIRSRPTLAGRQQAELLGSFGTVDVSTRLTGSWNLQNALLAVVMAQQSGADVHQAATGVAAVEGVPGRLQQVSASTRDDDDVVGFVDYAHTPDAVDQVLRELRTTVAGERRLIAVLGCGGDRDHSKRPLMGAAAARHADFVIVTDDNPRSEVAGSIREAVLEGARAEGSGASIMDIGDRRRAIEAAVTLAHPDGVIAVLGKGHETGQEVAGVITPFDDLEVLQSALDAAAER